MAIITDKYRRRKLVSCLIAAGVVGMLASGCGHGASGGGSSAAVAPDSPEQRKIEGDKQAAAMEQMYKQHPPQGQPAK